MPDGDWEGRRLRHTRSVKPMGHREKTAVCKHAREPSDRNSPEDT